MVFLLNGFLDESLIYCLMKWLGTKSSTYIKSNYFLYQSSTLVIIFSLSHSHTLSIFHSLTLNMLNNFCFHVYAQNSLLIGEDVFFDTLLLITLSCEFRVHRAGSQLKMSESQKSDVNLSSLKFVKCAKCLCLISKYKSKSMDQ